MRIKTAKHEGTSPSRLARTPAPICLLLSAFVACPPFRSAVAEPQTTAANTREPMSLPPTPAGRQFAEWLQAFNTGDRTEIRSFIAKHFEEAALKRIPAEE